MCNNNEKNDQNEKNEIPSKVVGKILFISEDDLREKLKEFWGTFIKDNAMDVVSMGKHMIPTCIVEEGIDEMSLNQLCEISDPWTDMECSNEDYEAIAVFTESRNVKILGEVYLPREVTEKLDAIGNC